VTRKGVDHRKGHKPHEGKTKKKCGAAPVSFTWTLPTNPHEQGERKKKLIQRGAGGNTDEKMDKPHGPLPADTHDTRVVTKNPDLPMNKSKEKKGKKEKRRLRAKEEKKELGW